MKVGALLAGSVLSLTLPMTSATADTAYQFFLDSGYNSNLFNTPSGNYPRDSGSLALAVNRQHTKRLTLNSARQWQSGIALEQTFLDEELTEVRLHNALALLWQPRPGFIAPWYEFSVQPALVWHQFSNYQHLQLVASAKRTQRLTDRLTWQATGAAETRLYRESVLNRTQLTLRTGADWHWSNNNIFYGELMAGYGQVHSSYSGMLAPRAHHIVGEYGDSALGSDYFFDDDLSHINGGLWYTYRYTSGFGSLGLGFNRRLSQAIALDVHYQFAAQINADVTYDRHQASLRLIWQPLR